MPKKSPVSRTKELLEKLGFKTGTVERWIPYSMDDPRRKFRPGEKSDLFGIIDMIAIRPGQCVGVQICGTDFAAHVRKISASEYTRPWLESGSDLWLIGWRKVQKKRGGKLRIYKPRIGIFSVCYKRVCFQELKTEEEQTAWMKNPKWTDPEA